MHETPETTETPPFVFNPFSSDFDLDPHPVYAHLREKSPVHYWPEGRAFLVSRIDDVLKVLEDEDLFSTEPSVAAEFQPRSPAAPRTDFDMLLEKSLFYLSPKNHTRVRKLVSPAFTPRAVERIRADVQTIVDRALHAHEGAGTIDIPVDLAAAIPLKVISGMLAIPPELDQTFARFGFGFIELSATPGLTPEQIARAAASIPAGVTLLRDLIRERKKRLGDDLLSALIRAEEAGDRLEEEEMLGLIATLIGAGSETTMHFICFGTYHLLKSPDTLAFVREDPARIRALLDEVLRFDNFGKLGVPRHATRDLELHGTKIRRGQSVIPLIAAATLDPAAFADPEVFDIRRPPGEHSHLPFGHGAHYCLGAALARLEGEVAIGSLIRRFPSMRLVGEPAFGMHPFLRRMSSLVVDVRPEGR